MAVRWTNLDPRLFRGTHGKVKSTRGGDDVDDGMAGTPPVGRVAALSGHQRQQNDANSFERHAAKSLEDRISRKNRTAMFAEQLMSADVRTIDPGASTTKAAAVLDEMGSRHLPVLVDGKLVGMLSDRDLLRARVTKSDVKGPTISAPRVADVMSTRVLTGSPETPLREVARAMLDEQVHALPLVDDDGALVGIITSSDILRAVLDGTPINF